MIRANYHTHTVYCDGKNTPKEMVEAALANHMTHLGFSGHAWTEFGEEWVMSPDAEARYRKDVAEQKAAFSDRITILCGLEMDYFSPAPTVSYDYTIGSVHALKIRGEYRSVDESEAVTNETVTHFYGGDYYAYVREYFDLEARVTERLKPTFLGHFDLVTKFNENEKYFSESDPRYRKPALEALSLLAETQLPLEINTGAMSRGYRSIPYPAPFLLKSFHDMGGQIVLSGDSHTADSLLYGYDAAVSLAKACGYGCSLYLTEKGWEEAPL